MEETLLPKLEELPTVVQTKKPDFMKNAPFVHFKLFVKIKTLFFIQRQQEAVQFPPLRPVQGTIISLIFKLDKFLCFLNQVYDLKDYL